MKLYIANCTKQNHDFTYRLPEDGRLKVQSIPMGGQAIVLRPDATPEVLRAILEQHVHYGLVDVSAIDRTSGFIGLCYSFDKPVDMEKIMRAHEKNELVLVEQGAQIRRDTAAAMSDAISRDTNGAVNRLEFEVVEIEKRGEDNNTMREKIEVVREGQEPRFGKQGEATTRNAKRRR